MLKAALDRLWSIRQDFQLDVHFVPQEMSPYINVHNRYGYDELHSIFEETDILIVPSMWYETFGYTALEALSYGVPVILSNTVGAKDILAEGAGIVIDDINLQKLSSEIGNLTAEKLRKMNEVILEKQTILTIDEMAKDIFRICYLGEHKDA